MTSHAADARRWRTDSAEPTPIDHVCVKPLGGNLRVTVVFEAAERARITPVGTHDDMNPVINVYTELTVSSARARRRLRTLQTTLA